MIFLIKQNDTSPTVKAILLNSKKKPIDLNGSTVYFILKHETAGIVVNSPCNIINLKKAIVVYEWANNDTSHEGTHFAEFKVNYPDGTTETFPNDDYLKIRVTSRLV